jgi:urea transporter
MSIGQETFIPQEPSWLRFPETCLRGIAQVDFQNNWLSGAVILGAIFYNSRVYGVACIVGVVVATLTAMALKGDKGLTDAGLFQFSGVLLAIGLVAYLNPNFTHGTWPSWQLWLFVILGSAFSAVITGALMAVGERRQMPTFTWPFNLTGWLFIFSALLLLHLHAGPNIKPGIPVAFHGSTGAYTWTTWYKGVGNGIAEVFFQDNWRTGYIMAAGLAINSRIGAGMALLGSAIGVGTAMVLGGQESTIQAGLFSFNAVLTAMALGGFFFVLNVRGFLYTVFGTIVTTWVWATIAVAFAPVGMPAFTGPFCIVATFMILAKWRFGGLVAVPPAEATTPEGNFRRRHEFETVPPRTAEPQVSASPTPRPGSDMVNPAE